MKATREDIHSLASGELKGKEAAELKEAIKDCHASQCELKWAESVRTCLQEKAIRHDAPECFNRAKEQIRAIDARTQTESFVGRFSWAFVAAVAVFILAGVTVNRMTGRSELGQATMASLFTGLQVSPGAEQRPGLTLERVFGRVPCDLTTGFQAREVANGAISGYRTVRFRGADTYGPLTLLVIEGADSIAGFSASNKDYFSGQVVGGQGVSWKVDDLTMVLVGDRSQADLVQAAELLRR
jgi:hypothetical protein